MQDKQPWIEARTTADDGQPTTEAQQKIDNCLHICLQLCANLAPRKMRGIESNGMILMAEDKEGKLYFVKPDNVIGNGSEVR
jgi:hypothetical protein